MNTFETNTHPFSLQEEHTLLERLVEEYGTKWTQVECGERWGMQHAAMAAGTLFASLRDRSPPQQLMGDAGTP